MDNFDKLINEIKSNRETIIKLYKINENQVRSIELLDTRVEKLERELKKAEL